MKKHYIRLTAVIAALILTAFVLSLGLYTYATATKILNEKLDYAAGRASIAALKGSEDVSEDKLIAYLYGRLEEKTWFTKNDKIGFYEVVDIDENTRIESKGFIKAWTNSDDGKDTVENKRYILPGNDFKINDIWFDNFEADAVCDSDFIFNGTFKYHDYSTGKDVKNTIPYNSMASADDAVPLSEVFGDDRIDAKYYTFETTKYEAKLNREAKEKLEEVRDKLEKRRCFKSLYG